MIWKQSDETFNPLYANTSTLCHCANLKSLGKFYEKFSVNTYGIFMFKHFNTVKMISFMKLIFEDIFQLVIQIMFFIFLKGGDFDGLLLLSIGFSVFSALSWINEIYYDTSSRLSSVNINKLLRKFCLILVVLTYSIEKHKYCKNIYKAFRRIKEDISEDGIVDFSPLDID